MAANSSLRDVAEALGMSHAWVANFLNGDVPYAKTLAKIERFVSATPDSTDDDEAAVEWFRDLEQVTRNLQGTAPKGEAKQFKQDQLELIRVMHLNLVGEPVPDWWYMLRGKVDEGEISRVAGGPSGRSHDTPVHARFARCTLPMPPHCTKARSRI